MNLDLPPPPPTRREDAGDELHGEWISDPYRWLEDGHAPETIAWVEAQNEHTRALLDRLPGRERIRDQLRELLSIGSVSAPTVRNRRHFYLRRDGTQNQPVLFMRDSTVGAERVLIDPNQLDAGGTIALDWWHPSRDGRLLTYGLSRDGSEQSVLQVLDVDRGKMLPDVIPNTRAASVAWLVSGEGFYYTRHPAPGSVPPGEEMYYRRVYLHRLGQDAAADPLVFAADLDREDWPSVWLSADGQYLLLSVNHGWDRSDLYIRREFVPDADFQPVIVGEHALTTAFIAGGRLYLHTNLDAPRYRLCAVDPADPRRDAWQEIVREQPDAVLQGARIAAERLLLVYLREAASALESRAPDGTDRRELPLPALGSIGSLTGEEDGDAAYCEFSSYAMPPTVYRYEPGSDSLTVWATVSAPIDPADYQVRRETYRSRDGTCVSMFVVHRAGLARTGANPTLLSGYGGFNISMTPSFGRSILFWLQCGGVYAVPQLRGGGEYGEEWHRAGMLERKQNVFDDFFAAAEHLIAAGYTRPERLAISGGSNGGLLVGAAITQRPELFRAAVCAVPLLDMLRYHRFQIARLWIPEYGSAEDHEQFAWLRSYSPYHRVRTGISYPALLLLTADTDTRVDPLHARKMAALLQHVSRLEDPVLLRVEFQAGHGAGRPLSKILAEQSDVWAFLCWQLGVDIAPARA